jgi:hypothetical protein
MGKERMYIWELILARINYKFLMAPTPVENVSPHVSEGVKKK